MYHISDIKKFLRCEHLYHLSKGISNTFKPYLRTDENIVDLLKTYFQIETCFDGIRNDECDRFFNNLDEYEWFAHPRFADGELRINIPLMHKIEDRTFDIYFVVYNTSVKEPDLVNYRISVAVLEKLGLLIRRFHLVYFNGDYVNDGLLDVKKLLVCTDRLNGRKIIDIIKEKAFDYQSILMKMADGLPEKQPEKNRYCHLNGLCEYYRTCFPEEEDIDQDSILHLVSSRNKDRMFKEGLKSLKEADPELIEGNRVQYAQIMASRNGGLFIDRNGLYSWLEKLDERPISFIDFEWDRYLVPPYRGMCPLDVVCFEFALYYIDREGHMEHRTFVGTGDCRREFIEALLTYLPDEGPVTAYNATGAEVLRLKELAEVFPEYRDKLMAICARFVDLAVPFSEGLIYHVAMEGNFSLKKLVDICSDYSYHSLDIDDGMEAVYNWRDIDKKESADEEKVINDLKEYCSLDAYGLFLVYRWLIKLLIESA